MFYLRATTAVCSIGVVVALAVALSMIGDSELLRDCARVATMQAIAVFAVWRMSGMVYRLKSCNIASS